MPCPRRDQHRVLALPAEAGRLREGLLHDGGGVAEDLHPHVALGRQVPAQLFQAPLQNLVIIPPLRVGGDGTAVAASHEVEGIVLRPVAHRQDQDAAHPRPERDRAGPLVGPLRHPVHGALRALGEPGGQAARQVGEPVGTGHAQAAEPERPGPGRDEAAQVGAMISPSRVQKSRSA